MTDISWPADESGTTETSNSSAAGVSALSGIVSSEQILKEVGFALACDRPVGFLAIVISESEHLEMIIPTIIEIGAQKDLAKYKQREIREKMHELGELIKEVYR